ncbi:related to quinic acid utilisation protein QUTG (inositol-1(or 4)-monophosphatase) [Pseudozyma flocculosa]|uniref:Inositol-1-monophosphatase n=1 Tax=Pseudozyma flocculosa TaxID=84751 RepID=A0A5C3ERX2_9BASI|nr:related to quinic acid utilisation protein QUTG (inositol-1(or 4)-monophosphatase) [Pseudozyma flocculosa]
MSLEQYHDFATDLAVRAGALLCQSAFTRAQAGYCPPSPTTSLPSSTDNTAALNIKDKDSSVDVVTDTDIAVENFIIGEIKRRFPEHRILAEETYAAGGSKKFELGDEPTWIVDPLDGTVNYVHLFPLICISIGLTINKHPVVGAIYAPLLGGFDRHAHGLRRSPSTGPEAQDDLGDNPRPLRLPLSPLRLLSETAPSGLLVASEWGKDRRPSPEGNLMRKANTFLNLASSRSGIDNGQGGRKGGGVQVHGIRSLGSAALDLAYCASGSVDVFWEGGCWEWDVCAGLAILYEAGGMATDANAPPPGSRFWDANEDVPAASLGARRFLCIRPCCDNDKTGETAKEAQRRVARGVWKALDQGGLDYNREGVTYAE